MQYTPFIIYIIRNIIYTYYVYSLSGAHLLLLTMIIIAVIIIIVTFFILYYYLYNCKYAYICIIYEYLFIKWKYVCNIDRKALLGLHRPAERD